MLEYRTAHLVFEAAPLLLESPPDFVHPNKVAAYKVGGSQTEGIISVSRWRQIPLPQSLPAKRSVRYQPGFFPYSNDSADVWVNFADPDLFRFCGTHLLAQDELQALEHPALASIRGALESRGVPPLTVEEGAPTPVYIEGVERRLMLSVEPCPDRPQGLYGRHFATASPAVICSATSKITPTLSNILAIAAPCGGRGFYTKEEMMGVLITAYTGLAPLQGKTIHSGFWGCGAFGGNQTLMILLQILAARLAGVDIVFHYGDAAGKKPCGAAITIAQALTGSVDSIVHALFCVKFKWGVGNGT